MIDVMMRVVQWNDVGLKVAIGSSSGGGVKRYEDNLYENVKRLRPDIRLERVAKNESYRLLGNALLNWLSKIENDRIDIIHATYQAISLGVYTRLAENFVVTVHDLIPMVYPQEFNSILFKAAWTIIPSALRKVDRIIAVSEFTKSEVVRLTGTPESNISVIHEGVDHTEYRQLPKVECKKSFNLSIKQKHVLVVASNAIHKRMDITKQVLKKIRSKRKDVYLLKAGYGENLKGEGVINMGYVPEKDMPKLFNAADVYMHTSQYEGFGLPVLEAMACGVPVVVSNKASLPEIVGPYGNIADLDAQNVAEQFSEKVLLCLDDKPNERAIEHARSFTWRKNAEETIKLYEELSHR